MGIEFPYLLCLVPGMSKSDSEGLSDEVRWERKSGFSDNSV